MSPGVFARMKITTSTPLLDRYTDHGHEGTRVCVFGIRIWMFISAVMFVRIRVVCARKRGDVGPRGVGGSKVRE